MRVICVSILLLWGILIAEVYDIGYYGSFDNLQMKQFIPAQIGLASEDYKAIGEWADKTDNFVYECNNNQLNFFKVKTNSKKAIYKYLYSNNPESITKEQVIYSAQDITASFKILFFHKNITGSDGYIYLSIKTISDNSTMLLNGGLVDSSSSEMWAGQILTERYWQTQKREVLWSGSWNNRYLIKNMQVGGGIIDVFPQTMVSYNVTLKFVTGDAPLESKTDMYLIADSPIYDYENIREKVLLDNPAKTYNIFIGKDKFLSNGVNTLYGNYGVVHEYEAVIKNKGKYECFYTCNGGPARYSLTIDDKYYSGYCNNNSTAITLLNLESPKSIFIKTIPLPGSNYPATITIKKKK